MRNYKVEWSDEYTKSIGDKPMHLADFDSKERAVESASQLIDSLRESDRLWFVVNVPGVLLHKENV